MAKSTTKTPKNIIPEILLYGIIGQGEGCVSAADFVGQIKFLQNDHPVINVRINSAGGSIFDGIAMYSGIKSSPAEINVYVDGVAASMASVVALAGNKCYMSSLAKMMTHKAKGVITGGADSMRTNAALLDSLENTMAVIYAQKTGLTEAEAKTTFMGAEDKWMTAQEALENKLIDGIFDATAQFDLPQNLTTQTEIWQAYQACLTTQKTNMEKFFLSAEQLSALNLKADAPIAEVTGVIDQLIAKAALVPTLEAKVKEQETAISTLKAEAVTKEIDGYVAEALKQKKITVELGKTLKAQFAGNPVGLKAVLEAMPSYTPFTSKIQDEEGSGELAVLEAKTYSELDKSGKLPRLKELSLDVFKAKFKTHFGVDYKE